MTRLLMIFQSEMTRYFAAGDKMFSQGLVALNFLGDPVGRRFGYEYLFILPLVTASPPLGLTV